MREHEEVEVWLHTFFNLGVRWGKIKVQAPAALPPAKEPPVPNG